MNARISNCRWISFAAVPLVCLMGSALWAADDAPATPAGVDVGAAPWADLGGLSATQFLVRSINLAANTSALGADVAQVDDVLRSHLGLADGKGLVVSAVADDGPAAKAGIQKNDVLTTIGGEEISDLDAFRKSLEAAAGKPIAIGLIRAGKKQSIELIPIAPVIADLDLSAAIAQPKYWLGVGLACADDALRSQLSLPAGEGLVVTHVEEKSPAAEAGIMVNDLLLQIDGKPLTTIEALTEQQQAIADKPVELRLLRRGQPATLTVTAALHTEAASVNLRFLQGNFRNLYSVNVIYPVADINGSAFEVRGERPDVAKQLSDLEAQLKQMEASLAALRAAIGPAAQPAQSSEEKK